MKVAAETEKITPLLRFLRAMDKEHREAFAAACETTEVYLYQLAAKKFPNPRLRLGLALVAESKRVQRKWMTPALTLDDLLVGTEGPDDEPPRARLKRRSESKVD